MEDIIPALRGVQKEIKLTMDSREAIGESDLQGGDPVFIKNYKKGSLIMKGVGPCIFLQYVANDKMSALVYYPKTRKVLRVKIDNIAPMPFFD